MTKIVRSKHCPACGSNELSRRHRSFWMRLFRGSRHYKCNRCRTGMLLVGRKH